jgi:hypothetical protein
MADETRTSRLLVLIAGNAFVFSKLYDLMMQEKGEKPHQYWWAITVTFIGMITADMVLRMPALPGGRMSWKSSAAYACCWQ